MRMVRRLANLLCGRRGGAKARPMPRLVVCVLSRCVRAHACLSHGNSIDDAASLARRHGMRRVCRLCGLHFRPHVRLVLAKGLASAAWSQGPRRRG